MESSQKSFLSVRKLFRTVVAHLEDSQHVSFRLANEFTVSKTLSFFSQKKKKAKEKGQEKKKKKKKKRKEKEKKGKLT